LPEAADQQRHFLRELSFLIDIGAPIVSSMRHIQRDLGECELATTIDVLIQEVEGGSTLSEAMTRKAGDVFCPILCNMIRAGEAGGVLDIILQRIVDSIDRGFLDLSGREELARSEITPELRVAEHARGHLKRSPTARASSRSEMTVWQKPQPATHPSPRSFV
jgi:hypothetical protein